MVVPPSLHCVLLRSQCLQKQLYSGMLADASTFPYDRAMAEPPWLNESEMRTWRALLNTTTGVLATLDRELQAAHGVTLPEYEVLVILDEAGEGGLRMSDLAGRLHLSPSGLTRRIDALTKRRLVRRDACPSDRRVSYAVL